MLVNIFERKDPGRGRLDQVEEDHPWPRRFLTLIKLQIPGGQANPAPPVGPALGQHGVNIMEFCKAFNAQTQQEWADHGRDYGLRGPLIHVHHEDAAGSRAHQGGAAARQGLPWPNREEGYMLTPIRCGRSPRRSSRT